MSFPRKFGKYTLIDRLAAGGMAEVFRGHLGPPGSGSKIIAIKRMLPNISGDEDFVKLFEKEIGLASQLTHQNLVVVYDFGTIDGQYYLAMEYVHGKSLQALQARAAKAGQPLDVSFCCYVVREVCRALDYAHGFKDPVTKNYAGIVHRDISPHNILLSYGGHVKLFDFGVAKIANKESSTIGSIKGKPAYLSPEQAMGKELDGRTDIFALGIVFWEILTGQRLFYADQPMVAMKKVLDGEIVRPSSINPLVPPELDAIVLGALDRDIYTRFQLSQDFGAAIEELMKKTAPGFGLEQCRQVVEATFSDLIEKENIELTAKLNGEEAQDPDSTGMMPVPGKPPPLPTAREPTKRKLNQQVSPNGTLVGMGPVQPPSPDLVPPPAPGPSSGALLVAASIVVAAAIGGYVALKKDSAPQPAPVTVKAAPIQAPASPPAPVAAKAAPAPMAHAPASLAEPAPPAALADKCRTRKMCGLHSGAPVTYPNACAVEEAKAVLAYEGACEASRMPELRVKELALNESAWKVTNASPRSAFFGESILIHLEVANIQPAQLKLQAVLKGDGPETASVSRTKPMITHSTAMSLGKDLPRGFYTVEVHAIGPGGNVVLSKKAAEKFYLGGPEELKMKVVDLGNKNYKRGSSGNEPEVDEEANRRAAAEAGIPYEEYKRVAEENARAARERAEFEALQQRQPAGK